MSAPLISDATFAKCVRLVSTFAMPNEDRWNIVRELIAGRYAVALDVVRDDRENATLIEALEEANEEAALGHDRREAEATPTAGLTWDTKPPTGEQIIADIEEMMRVFPPTTLDATKGPHVMICHRLTPVVARTVHNPAIPTPNVNRSSVHRHPKARTYARPLAAATSANSPSSARPSR
jgi:hypothetical protein